MVLLTPYGKGRFGVEPRSRNMQLQIAAAHWRMERSDSAYWQITLVLKLSFLLW